MMKRIKQWLLNDIFCSVDLTNVLTVPKSGILCLNGEQLSEVEIKQLKQEAHAIQNFRLWKIFQETVRQKAVEKSVIQSTDFEQTLSGKLMLHNLGIQKSIVEAIESYKK